MHATAVLVGLTGALMQALSYLVTRSFVTGSGRSIPQLMALAHLLMGGLALALLPFTWMPPAAGWGAVAVPLAGVTGFYLCGQVAFFLTLKHIPASQASPMLGVKIATVAAFSLLVFRQRLSAQQGAAVVVATAAALSLAGAGTRFRLRAVLALLVTLICYTGSDLSIPYLIGALDPDKGLQASLLAVSLSYILCGLCGLAVLRQVRAGDAVAWGKAAQFAVTWYAGMCCLYFSVARLGVVFANILQSSRGLISVGLAVLIAHLGHHHIEHETGPALRWRQALSAGCMCAAIALWSMGG